MRPLRIAQVAPPLERVPPRGYGGTERIIHELATELTRRGHQVTVFASGDSEVPCELVPTVPEALRPTGFAGDPSAHFLATVQEVLRRADEFDVIHSHVEWYSLLLAPATRTPVVSTFHCRLDFPAARDLLADGPRGLVAISRNQAGTHPGVPWTVVHNGLTLDGMPFDRRRGPDLAFVGRVAEEKGVVTAIEVARLAGRRLRIAAKASAAGAERDYYENVFLPALKEAPHVEYLGEVSPSDRDALMSESYAVLTPAAWPEPFGLVTIEALACGTPLLARRVGATPEIVRDGVDGFFGDDAQQLAFLLDRVDELDRAEIRRSVLERFSAKRMTDEYEAVYRRRLGEIEIETDVAAASAGAIPLRQARSAVAARTGRIDSGWKAAAMPGGGFESANASVQRDIRRDAAADDSAAAAPAVEGAEETARRGAAAGDGSA